MCRRRVSAVIAFALSIALFCAGSARTTALGSAGNGWTAAVYAHAEAHAKPAASPKPVAHTQPVARAQPVPAATPRPPSAQHVLVATARRDLTAAVDPLIRDDGDHVAVAVDDLASGAQAACGGTEEFITASIVKVDILATLLYQAQRAGHGLSASQQALATSMIEESNNDSASDLYGEVGGAAGVDAANRVFGLRKTEAGAAGFWGLTTTTADDQIRLLRQVFTRPSVLWPASQDYIRDLMGRVESAQQWGVPAAATQGTEFRVKNGWLPDPSLWEINSIGEVVHGHQRMLIAVLSDDNASEYGGISVVQEAAAVAAQSMVRAAKKARPVVWPAVRVSERQTPAGFA
jgi:hypothetical protein